ncbi:flagellar basal body-associated FliL family protein [Roseobacteraceae bacterium NS-SX3]
MLSKLLPVILLLLGTGGGIGAGLMLAPPADEHQAALPEGEDPHGEKPEKAYKKPAPEEEREYVKITNQFVVPVVERDELASLVVLSLSLETKKGLTETVHAYEPKLRDVFLQVLFDHANMGGFRGAFTRSDVMNPLRTALREAARNEMGPDVYDVLIMEISRQDV